MNTVELVEAADRWALGLVGCVIAQCRVDYGFTLVIEGAPGAFELRIEQAFELVRVEAGELPLLLELGDDPTTLAPALALLHSPLEEAIGFKDGRLELRMVDGSRLRVAAGQGLEPWTLTGPDGVLMVSSPDGELVVWSPGSQATTPE